MILDQGPNWLSPCGLCPDRTDTLLVVLVQVVLVFEVLVLVVLVHSPGGLISDGLCPDALYPKQ